MPIFTVKLIQELIHVGELAIAAQSEEQAKKQVKAMIARNELQPTDSHISWATPESIDFLLEEDF